MVVNSVIADPIDGARLPAAGFTIEGVAWDRGHGIKQVEVSLDGGKSWKQATLGKDLGRFAFRGFSFHTGKIEAGNYVLSSRATNNAGETQVDTLKFNPGRLPQQRAAADPGHGGIGRRSMFRYLTHRAAARRPGARATSR